MLQNNNSQKTRSAAPHHSIIVFMSYCILFFSFSEARLRTRGSKENIFIENKKSDSNTAVTDSDDYIIIFKDDKQMTNNNNNARVNSVGKDDYYYLSLSDEIKKKYNIQRKNVYRHGFHGLLASNLTESDLLNIQKEKNVLLIEKDLAISIDPLENVVQTVEDHDDHKISSMNKKQKRKNQRHQDNNKRSSNTELIPPGVKLVGYRNVENDPILRNKRIFIIDTGVIDDHDEFNLDTTLARNFVPSPPHRRHKPWRDCHGHGTHVAGTIAARENGVGVVGVAAGAVIVPIRTMDCNGEGRVSHIIRAIHYVASVAEEGDVINLSIGTPVPQRALDRAVRLTAKRTGAVFVTAAGNGGDDARKFSPGRANGRNMFTVCAISTDEESVAEYSNFGTPPVDVCAPGNGVISLGLKGKKEMRSGTSMAAPHVSGALFIGSKKGSWRRHVRGPGGEYPIVSV